MAKTAADQVAEMMIDAGIQRVYGVVGDSINPIVDAIRRRDAKLRWVHCRNEEVGAFAAGADALLTGQIAACAGSCVPSNLHLIQRQPMLPTSLAHLHAKARKAALGLPEEFVLHSLRHTFCTRLSEAGAEAFQIRKLAGHHSVTVSERCVHPTPESAALAIRRLDAANRGLSGASTDTTTDTGTLALSVSH
jgi:integrase